MTPLACLALPCHCQLNVIEISLCFVSSFVSYKRTPTNENILNLLIHARHYCSDQGVEMQRKG